MNDWRQKVVLVTGGSAGLGHAIASAFARAGARVVLAARDHDRLAAATAALRAAGLDVLDIAADVTEDDQTAALVAETIARCGRLDVLVNNVGRSTRGAVLDVTPEEFAELFRLNVLTAVRCTRAAAPHLIATRGHIVNIGSLAAKSAARYLGAYPASKFALAAYSQQLRLELSPQGVHVLLVCPGPIARDDAGERYEAHSAGLPESARQPGGGVKISRLRAENVAAKIVRACERRKSDLVIPAKARLLFAISQLSPGIGDWLVRRMT